LTKLSPSSLGPEKWWWVDASEKTATSHAFELRGVRLHYRVWSRGAGPLLLLVHGFRGHTHWWDWIAPAFRTDFDVVAVDLSGMGDSEWRPGYEADTFALDILGLIAHLDAGPARVVGHSFGGGSLLRACAIDSRTGTDPRIGHAIVVDSWVPLAGHAQPPAQARAGVGGPYADFETARNRFRLSPVQDVADSTMLDHLAHHSVRQTHDGWRWKFDPNLPSPDVRDLGEVLRRISTPVDIVYGESSSIVDRRRAEACVEALPHGRGPVAVPRAGHHLMFDQPLAFIAALRALLATGP
jgi:pimeloyl-ACP methyl ester carboxylesterase